MSHRRFARVDNEPVRNEANANDIEIGGQAETKAQQQEQYPPSIPMHNNNNDNNNDSGNSINVQNLDIVRRRQLSNIMCQLHFFCQIPFLD